MRSAPVIAAAGLSIALSACDNMANQPKRLPYELRHGAEANWPMGLILIVAPLMGIILGLFNGVLITKLGLPSLHRGVKSQ